MQDARLGIVVNNSYSETHAAVATGENFKVFCDTFLTLLQRGLMSYTCNSSSPFVKVSKRCQKNATKDFEIFPGGNGSVRLAVIVILSKNMKFNTVLTSFTIYFQKKGMQSFQICPIRAYVYALICKFSLTKILRVHKSCTVMIENCITLHNL